VTLHDVVSLLVILIAILLLDLAYALVTATRRRR
jgi:hypothetical protein